MELRSASRPRAKRRRIQLELDTPLVPSSPVTRDLTTRNLPTPQSQRTTDDQTSIKANNGGNEVDARESRRAPVPFVPARKAVLNGFKVGISTYLSTPSKLTLAIAMEERLTARDWSGAAAIIPFLSKRFRRVNDYPWYFAREIMVAGSEVLRRCTNDENEDGSEGTLNRFLEMVMRGDGVGLVSAPGYGLLVRETALLELLMELIVNNRIEEALDIVREETKREPFVSSTLVQGYLGMLDLLYYEESGDEDSLKEASEALLNAASRDPEAYCFMHYAAACKFAARDVNTAVDLLREVVKRNPMDPYAIATLMKLLLEVDEFQTDENVQNERVHLARRLLSIDPMAREGLDVLEDSRGLNLESPPGRNLEIAQVYARRIETTSHACAETWKSLAETLPRLEGEELSKFWKGEDRCRWWLRGYFHPSRAHGDYKISRELVKQKLRVALLLAEDHAYVKAANVALDTAS